MAESVALAVLENLVHMSRDDFPIGYVAAGALIPSRFEILVEDQAGEIYGDLPDQTLGDLWLESLRTAVLRVRSAVVPNECNYLLNPRHPDFQAIVVELPVAFQFDERLFR